jgi:acyl-CoA hydrolase
VKLYHRLILRAEANHNGTLYAGSLLRLALESGHATAWKYVGPQANLLLRRVLDLECLYPVPVGTVIEIEGAVLYRAQAYLVTGQLGMPLKPGEGPWLEALLGFTQVDEAGRPAGLPKGAGPPADDMPPMSPGSGHDCEGPGQVLSSRADGAS